MTRRQYRGGYLRSPWWISFRAGWWSRHPNAVCLRCKKPRNFFAVKMTFKGPVYVLKGHTIDLHHLTYERIGCERDTDVIPLCRSCHKLVHNQK